MNGLPPTGRDGGCITHHKTSTFCLLLMSLLVISSDLAFVKAQSSCSTPQVISAPSTINPALIQNFNSIPAYQICDPVTFPSSIFQTGAGLWFSYTSPVTTIARVVVQEIVDTGTETATGFPPNILIFKGSCDSLSCEKEQVGSDGLHFQANMGVEYLIYIFREFELLGLNAFSLTLEEIEPPSNDIMENAIPLTNQDLPYRGDFTTYGALSDFNQDACGLDGEYGVWITYTTTLSEEVLTLQATSENLFETVGIQTQSDDGGFVCVAIRYLLDLEWTAKGDVTYYILVADPDPHYAAAFELTLQSRSSLQAPTSPLSPVAAPAPTPATAASPESQQSANESAEASSSSKAFLPTAIFGTRFNSAILFFLILVV